MHTLFCTLFTGYLRAGSGLPVISGPQGEEHFEPWILPCMCHGSSVKCNSFFVKVNLQGYLLLKKSFQLILALLLKEATL